MMLFYAVICRCIPKKLVAMSIFHTCMKNNISPESSIDELFQELTK